jgi:hypothetical protein
VDASKAKEDIKGSYHIIKIEPAGRETWTFTYELAATWTTAAATGKSLRTTQPSAARTCNQETPFAICLKLLTRTD